MPSTIDHAAALFEQLRPRLTAISRRIVGSDAEAQDIVQDCFMKWQATDQAAVTTPAAWLTTVARRQAIDVLRQRARGMAVEQAIALPAAGAPPEQTLLDRAEMTVALARLLALLSPAERLALVLHEAFDCRAADIAAALGTSAVNARQHLSRARRRLRQAQAGQDVDDKLARELVRHFQAAIDGQDVPAMVNLLADSQPVSVLAPSQPDRDGCANDGCYALAA
jgi:RNA polymerase sigma factor (sigma-70 family)